MIDILFVQNYYEQQLGIMYISALLKQNGFTTDVVIGSKKDIIKKTLEKRPRVIGFYCTTGYHHKAISIASDIKKILGDKILTILGGPHPTFIPEVIDNKGIDIVCRGEGEYAVLELIKSLSNNEDYTGIKNLVVKKDDKIYKNDIRPVCDLNMLPHPDREIYKNNWYIYKNKRQTVMLGRGCYFNCSFCSSPAFKELYRGKGNYVRFNSIPNAIGELENIKNRYNFSSFIFYDDSFLSENRHCLEFLEIYKEKINIPYACMIRASQMNNNFAKLLKATGCHFIGFGIESGNARLRNMLMKKKISDENILKCAALLHKYKIPFATFNIIGFPGETLQEAWDTVNINERIKPIWAFFSIYKPLPMTELTEFAINKGYIKAIDVETQYKQRLLQPLPFLTSSVILKNNPRGKKMLRLKNSANLIVKMPFLRNFVSVIILNFPFEALYDLIYNFMYFMCYYIKLTYKQGFLGTICSFYFIMKSINDQKY